MLAKNGSSSTSGEDHQDQQQPQQQPPQGLPQQPTTTMMRNQVVIKVGMVGDSQIGKTSLMVKYVQGSFDEDYIQTLGKRR